jgi:hypothetical protein
MMMMSSKMMNNDWVRREVGAAQHAIKIHIDPEDFLAAASSPLEEKRGLNGR